MEEQVTKPIKYIRIKGRQWNNYLFREHETCKRKRHGETLHNIRTVGVGIEKKHNGKREVKS